LRRVLAKRDPCGIFAEAARVAKFGLDAGSTLAGDKDKPDMHDKNFLALADEFGHVTECDCGSIQMRVGPVTLALDENALRRLHEMVTEAVGKLDAASDKAVQDDPLVTGAVRSAWGKLSRTRH
jgi:hypothetical protein